MILNQWAQTPMIMKFSNQIKTSYIIYLPEIKMVNRLISRQNKENLRNEKFKLFTFIDESNLTQKIRVEFYE